MTTNIDNDPYEQLARRAADSIRDSLRAAQADPASPADPQLHQLLAANADLLAGTAAAQSCGGSFSWANAFFYGTLVSSPTLSFAGWGSLKFAGQHGGLGLGGGISYTVGACFVRPEELIGDVTYSMAFAPSTVTISFYRNLRLVVLVVGPTLAAGVGVMVGTGRFTRP